MCIRDRPKTSRLVLADYVTMDSGTGCVHTAPGFGADDYVTCKRYGMDMVVPCLLYTSPSTAARWPMTMW